MVGIKSTYGKAATAMGVDVCPGRDEASFDAKQFEVARLLCSISDVMSLK